MEIALRDLKQLLNDDGDQVQPALGPALAKDLGLRIFILQRGWLIVGIGTQTGCNVIIRDGSVIRRWGTGRGLGQLAKDGPLAKTALDPVGITHVHELGIVASIECNPSSWGN